MLNIGSSLYVVGTTLKSLDAGRKGSLWLIDLSPDKDWSMFVDAATSEGR
jgi:hypothetical protein